MFGLRESTISLLDCLPGTCWFGRVCRAVLNPPPFLFFLFFSIYWPGQARQDDRDRSRTEQGCSADYDTTLTRIGFESLHKRAT